MARDRKKQKETIIITITTTILIETLHDDDYSLTFQFHFIDGENNRKKNSATCVK